MTTPAEPTAFDRRWTALGLAAGGPPVALDATLRADTLAQLGAPAPAATEIAYGAELPRVSLALPEAPNGGDPGVEIEATALLGEGGMGRVYLARQRSLGREVAVKLVRPEARSGGAAAALLREARVTGALEHPNVVPVHLLGHTAERDAVLVLKRIEGVAWRELLRDAAHPMWARLPRADDRLAANLDILMHVCNALDFAHSRGVVHRDIKPENVMVGAFGEVYLLDWGIALRGTDAEAAGGPLPALVGTPAYLAPEMVIAGTIDARTDVYLLGATLHEVLTGAPRHRGETLREVLLAAYESAVVAYPPEVPAELGALCNAATSHDPAGRPPSVAAFRQALADFLQHRGSLALGEQAEARLAELRSMLGPDAPAREALLSARAWELMTECRFAFLQALRAWAGNGAARQGLQVCLELTAERALEQRNPDAARSALAELGEPRPDLAGRVERLEKDLSIERADVAELQRQRREMDASVSSRPRAIAFWGLLAMGLLSSGGILVGEWSTGKPAPARDLLPIDVALFVGAAVAVAITRRKLFANTFNRRMVGIAAVAALPTAPDRHRRAAPTRMPLLRRRG